MDLIYAFSRAWGRPLVRSHQELQKVLLSPGLMTSLADVTPSTTITANGIMSQDTC